MKDPVEVQPPGGDFFFVVLRVEKARNGIAFAQADNVSLDLCHGPAIEGTVSQSESMHVSTGPTYVVSCSIASNTDRLN